MVVLCYVLFLCVILLGITLRYSKFALKNACVGSSLEVGSDLCFMAL